MIMNISEDSGLRPDLFIWRGGLSPSAIEEWERRGSIRAPNDLKELWSTKGGGDLFESENILQPFGAPDYDLIEPVSQAFWSRGLDKGYYVFHTGAWDSVFRRSDGALFSINSSDPGQMSSLHDLNEWYQGVRAEYAERYALPVCRKAPPPPQEPI